MSWTISISPTPRDDFDAAVDRAEASGQDLELPGVRDDVEAAKGALKNLAQRVKRPLISATAYGHSLQEDEGPNWHDGVSVSVTGSAAAAEGSTS
jgi:hypothetical protein